MNRASNNYVAYALIDSAGKLWLNSAEVPIFWQRGVAQVRADKLKDRGFNLHVEKIIIGRTAPRPSRSTREGENG